MSPDDELCIRIGRVARAHARIDSQLRQVFRGLVDSTPAMWLVNRSSSTNALVDQIAAMLRDGRFEEDFLVPARAVLQAAKEAGEERNRIVHDEWYLELRDGVPIDPPEWRTMRITSQYFVAIASESTRDLASIDATLALMHRTFIRVFALDWWIQLALPHNHGTWSGSRDEDGSQRAELIRMMNDEFVVNSQGKWKVLRENLGP